MAVLNADFWPAVPLRLATLAAAERQAKEKHPHGTERPGEGLIMKGIRRIISREHVRVRAKTASRASAAQAALETGEAARLTGRLLRRDCLAHRARACRGQLLACREQLLHLLMNQRAERAIGFLFGLSVADPAPRKQIRAVAHIQAVGLFPSDELKIVVLSFHLLAARSAPGAFHH